VHKAPACAGSGEGSDHSSMVHALKKFLYVFILAILISKISRLCIPVIILFLLAMHTIETITPNDNTKICLEVYDKHKQ
jgi:hypothetical protein